MSNDLQQMNKIAIDSNFYSTNDTLDSEVPTITKTEFKMNPFNPLKNQEKLDE